MCTCGHGMPWHRPKTRNRPCELCDCSAYEQSRSQSEMTWAEVDALARGECLRSSKSHGRIEPQTAETARHPKPKEPKMAKKNRDWSPTLESSPGASIYRGEIDENGETIPGTVQDDDRLYVVAETGECRCGCREQHHPEFEFIRGHDQTLKGKLARAAKAKAGVVIISGGRIDTDAVGAANHLLLTPEGVAQVERMIARGQG